MHLLIVDILAYPLKYMCSIVFPFWKDYFELLRVIVFFNSAYVCASECKYVQCPTEARRMPGFLGAGITDGCEPIIVGACNWTLVLWKRRTSEPFHQFQVVFVCLFVCFHFKCMGENDKTCFEKEKKASSSKRDKIKYTALSLIKHKCHFSEGHELQSKGLWWQNSKDSKPC